MSASDDEAAEINRLMQIGGDDEDMASILGDDTDVEEGELKLPSPGPSPILHRRDPDLNQTAPRTPPGTPERSKTPPPQPPPMLPARANPVSANDYLERRRVEEFRKRQVSNKGKAAHSFALSSHYRTASPKELHVRFAIAGRLDGSLGNVGCWRPLRSSTCLSQRCGE